VDGKEADEKEVTSSSARIIQPSNIPTITRTKDWTANTFLPPNITKAFKEFIDLPQVKKAKGNKSFPDNLPRLPLYSLVDTPLPFSKATPSDELHQKTRWNPTSEDG